MNSEVKKLIDDLAPHYNQYKRNKNTISGNEALKIMWRMGETLSVFIKQHSIAPHALYREVYGRSDGSLNIAQKSWITREFQGRCYRIRNMFRDTQEIDSLFPNLESFTLFRDAMPFFDNKKYLLRGQNRADLIKVLNSDKSSQEIRDYIQNLKDKYIGISNPRTQRLAELDNEKQIFGNFYKYAYKLLNSEPEVIKEELLEKKITKEFVDDLAVNLNALLADDLRYEHFSVPANISDEIWLSFSKTLLGFMNDTNRKRIRRFRRVFPNEQTVKIASMLYEAIEKANS